LKYRDRERHDRSTITAPALLVTLLEELTA